MRSLRILRTVKCPDSVTPITLEKCKKCEWHKGMTGYHSLDQKVTCAHSIEGLDVEFAVFCPMAQKMLPFRKCLNCMYMTTFYGFHDENPVLKCGYQA